MKQTLYLIRHGITAGTNGTIMYGATDLPLVEEGIAAIKLRVAKGLYPSADGAAMYSSGISRVEHTFELIFGGAEHEQVPDIREINFGKFEMMLTKDIMADEWGARWLRGEIENPEFEGGDSVTGFVERINRGMDHILADAATKGAERIIVVCHGGTIAATMERFFHGEAGSIWDWVCEPGTGYEIQLDDGKALSYRPFGNDKEMEELSTWTNDAIAE